MDVESVKSKGVYIIVCCFIFLFSCKKNKDTVTTQTIHGQVYNLCTDSGLANVVVHLNISDPTGGHSITTTSGINGSFTFSNVQIHSSSDYKYEIAVYDEDGMGYKPGIDGANIVLDKGSLSQNFKLNVLPHFKSWSLFFSNIIFTSSDTFILSMKQNKIHKNTSNSNWQSIDNCPCPITTPTHYAGGLGNYWMGWWQVTLDKTKNGVHTIKTDSFYVGWGATVTDTIPW